MIAVSSESKEITDEDVRNVASAALVRSTPPERQIVAILPQDFTSTALKASKTHVECLAFAWRCLALSILDQNNHP